MQLLSSALLLSHSASATPLPLFTITSTTVAVIGLLITALTLLISSFIRMRSNGKKDGEIEQQHKYMQQQIEILMKSENVVNYATVQIQVNGLLKEVERIDQNYTKEISRLDMNHSECTKHQSEQSRKIYDLLREIDNKILNIYKDGNRQNKNR